jgi:hypothetical protein
MAIGYNKPGSNLVTIKSLSSSAVKSAKFPFANLLIISFDSGKCSKRDGSGLFPLLTIGLGCRNLLIVRNAQFHLAIVSPVVAAKFPQGFKCSQAASQHSFQVLFGTSCGWIVGSSNLEQKRRLGIGGGTVVRS